MEIYRSLYFALFGKVSDIIEAMDLMGDPPEVMVKQVRSWLIQTLQEAEEMYLREGELPKEE